MNILVTGGDGQIAIELAKYSKESKNKYFFLNKKKLDIRKFEKLFFFSKKNKIDVIINTAAYTKVDKCENNKRLSNSINNIAVNNLIKVCEGLNIILIHLSTDYIFNGKKTTPYLETDIPDPLNYYGLTKIKAEEKIKKSKCMYLIFRLSSIYTKKNQGFMLSIIDKAKKNKKIKVIDNYISSPTSARSVAIMLLKIVDDNSIFSKKIICNTFNFCQSGSVSKFTFAKKIIKFLGLDCKCLAIKKDIYSNIKRPKYSVLSTKKFKSTFNIKINTIDYELKKILL